MDIDIEKKQIRKLIREEKRKYSLDQKILKSVNIIKQLESLDVFKTSSVVMAYWSMDDEVFTHEFILKHYTQKEIILPVVKGDVLELRKFIGANNLKQGASYGIAEPEGEEFKNIESIDLIIVPGVAFDVNNNRLGRGKAYYDKLLKYTSAYKVGICFDFQLLDSVPTDKFDIGMNKVIYG